MVDLRQNERTPHVIENKINRRLLRCCGAVFGRFFLIFDLSSERQKGGAMMDGCLFEASKREASVLCGFGLLMRPLGARAARLTFRGRSHI